MRIEALQAWLDDSAAYLRSRRGARALSWSVVFGLCGALAFPPFEIFPALLASYAGLVLLLEGGEQGGRGLKRAFFIGWAYGFGFFFAGLHWIGYAFLVNSDEHLWLLPFAAILMPGGLALFFAVGAAIVTSARRDTVSRVFLFALVFGALEYVRGHIFTGFPWNLPAYAWGASSAMLQSASLFGAYGLSILTFLLGASLALFAKDRVGSRHAAVPAALCAFFLLLWGHGVLRLELASQADVPGVRLRIVQPDTPQSEKYKPEYIARNWQRLIDLTAEQAAEPPTHVIWPEAAPPLVLMREPQALKELAEAVRPYRALLTGAVRVDNSGERQAFYNSFYIFDGAARLLATYDKFHLVPFGEYLPFEKTLNSLGITQIAGGPGGFSSGDGPRTYVVPGAPPVGPLICYEIIFPGAVVGRPRPQWLASVTDDSWFGPNAGPMQHLLIARVRAIEEGLPVARAANGGISAVIDSHGRIRDHLALGLRGVLDANLPVAVAAPPYARYGKWIVLLLLAMCAAASYGPIRRQQKS